MADIYCIRDAQSHVLRAGFDRKADAKAVKNREYPNAFVSRGADHPLGPSGQMANGAKEPEPVVAPLENKAPVDMSIMDDHAPGANGDDFEFIRVTTIPAKKKRRKSA